MTAISCRWASSGRNVTRSLGAADIEFSPDGKDAVSTSYDGTIRVWPIPTASEDILCDKMTSNMSRKTWNSSVSPDIPYHKLCQNLPIDGEVGK
ncbi:hypothetical protein ACIBG0_42140 [Nocardia sp. NPDC050630]|uniref:hypothetical protein n=1 Tax=Nocardia sp. NPDC050630 TaxID=3364321 RepID=UPI0037B6F9C4